jgi:hypothetical protein
MEEQACRLSIPASRANTKTILFINRHRNRRRSRTRVLNAFATRFSLTPGGTRLQSPTARRPCSSTEKGSSETDIVESCGSFETTDHGSVTTSFRLRPPTRRLQRSRSRQPQCSDCGKVYFDFSSAQSQNEITVKLGIFPRCRRLRVAPAGHRRFDKKRATIRRSGSRFHSTDAG